jgi:uncharacterized membrane protein
MPNDTAASYANVQEMAERLQLSEAGYLRATEIAQLAPDRDRLLRQIDRFLIAIGTLLIVVGIAIFFAWNWAGLSAAAKFALIETGIAVAVMLIWYFGLDSVPGRAGLLAAGFLTGTCLAVFGQVYQTGADPYGLFLTWAILILPWALIGRQAGLWLMLVMLLNLSIIMYYTQVLHPPQGWWQLSQLLGPLVWLGTSVTDSVLASYLFAVNAAALVLWEFGMRRGMDWMQVTWFPRVIAALALCTVVIPTIVIIVATGFAEQAGLTVLSPILMLGGTGLCLYYFRNRRHDLFILTCSLLSAILVVTSVAARLLLEGPGSLLVLALLLIAQVAGAAWWLRRVTAARDGRA